MDFLEIYKNLDFLEESIRLQYTNFIVRNYEKMERRVSYEEIFARLKAEEPIEYIFNLVEFYGNKFYVDKRVLIPRPETEEIVRRTLKFLENHSDEEFTILDIGTGSGAIILSIAHSLSFPRTRESRKDSKQAPITPGSPVKLGMTKMYIGIDISTEAVEVAKINAKKLGLEKHVEFQCFDFRDLDFNQFQNLIILANLPYIPNSRKLQKSVINFEPHLALFGGEKGNELIQSLKKKVQSSKNVKLLITEEDHGEIKVRK